MADLAPLKLIDVKNIELRLAEGGGVEAVANGDDGRTRVCFPVPAAVAKQWVLTLIQGGWTETKAK